MIAADGKRGLRTSYGLANSNDKEEVAIAALKTVLADAIQTLNDGFALKVADGAQVVGAIGYRATLSTELDDGLQVLRTVILPSVAGLAVEHKLAYVHLACCYVVVERNDEPRTVVQRQCTNGDAFAAHCDGRAVIGCNATAERTAVCLERRVAVQPDGTARHRAVEAQRAGPDIGVARIRLLRAGQFEHTVALLHQPHLAREGTARQRMGKGGGGYVIIVIVTLNPGRCIDHKHGWGSPVADADSHIVGLAYQQVVVARTAADGSTVFYFRSSFVGQRRRSHGDAFHLTKEVAQVGRLVIGHHLPHHRLAVLVVIPKSGGTVTCADI